MGDIAGHSFGLGDTYFSNYAELAAAVRKNVGDGELATQADRLTANDAALVALQGHDSQVDRVIDAVRFQTHLQLLCAPVYRRMEHLPEQIGRPLALCVQNTALETLGGVTGGTAGQILAGITHKVLAQFPLPALAHDLFRDIQTVTQPPNYWSPTDEGRLVHASSWIVYASDATKVYATEAVCDKLQSGAKPTVELMQALGHDVAGTARSDKVARLVLGNAIQTVSLGHVHGSPSTNIFDAEGLDVSQAQQEAAKAVDVGPHFPKHGGGGQTHWDRPVTREWLEQALDSIPASLE